MTGHHDEAGMRLALDQAHNAWLVGEVPVGAVIVRDTANGRQVVATGYNRNHLSTSEGGAIEAEAEMRNTADRTDTAAAVWMGMTANCASCHDHKFDPLTQKEYYSLVKNPV